MRKILFSLIAIAAFIITVNAQSDTMYVMKNGMVINKQSIKTTDVDSIIFYKPVNKDNKGKYFPYVATDWSLLYKPDPSIGNHINDHTLYRHESTGKWHLIGITQNTLPINPFTETYFAHGVSDSIITEGGYEETYQKLFQTDIMDILNQPGLHLRLIMMGKLIYFTARRKYL